MSTYPTECLPLQSDLLLDGTDPNVSRPCILAHTKPHLLFGVGAVS